ncbi:MAG: hypothetical protein E7322_03075 [Clostridiales bacterium]|nr:hypothetical protein [Clostridiales bacterium]
MRITDIIVLKDDVQFVLDEAYEGNFTLIEETPVIHGQTAGISEMNVSFHDGAGYVPRFAGEHDRAFGRFYLLSDEKKIGGVRYATEIQHSACSEPYPTLSTIKSLNTSYEIASPLGCDQQGRPDINLPAFISLREQPGTFPYRFEGQTYYIFEDAVSEMEKSIKGYKVSTVVVLNSPLRFGSKREEDMLKTCLHPKFEKDAPYAFISAFNMTTVEGQRVFAAFLSFLSEKYACGNEETGRINGAIISNEINLQYNWGNMGPVTPEYYMEEYTQALRLAWIASARHFKNFRVYISLANNWNVDVGDPRYFFRGKELIDLLGENCEKDGNFPWHVAHHPYPESFDHPDFWNDRHATFDWTTRLITYKNMEVLEKYLAKPNLLYKGVQRRILFSEQGFNSGSGPLSALMKKQAAAGYVLSFMKARNMKTVDMITHHSTIDNPHEFGLNLGIYEYDENAPYHKGKAKPIENMVRAMDTPYEGAAVEYAKQVIGEELFDYLLNVPEIVEEPEDLSNEFGVV